MSWVLKNDVSQLCGLTYVMFGLRRLHVCFSSLFFCGGGKISFSKSLYIHIYIYLYMYTFFCDLRSKDEQHNFFNYSFCGERSQPNPPLSVYKEMAAGMATLMLTVDCDLVEHQFYKFPPCTRSMAEEAVRVERFTRVSFHHDPPSKIVLASPRQC